MPISADGFCAGRQQAGLVACPHERAAPFRAIRRVCAKRGTHAKSWSSGTAPLATCESTVDRGARHVGVISAAPGSVPLGVHGATSPCAADRTPPPDAVSERRASSLGSARWRAPSSSTSPLPHSAPKRRHASAASRLLARQALPQAASFANRSTSWRAAPGSRRACGSSRRARGQPTRRFRGRVSGRSGPLSPAGRAIRADTDRLVPCLDERACSPCSRARRRQRGDSARRLRSAEPAPRGATRRARAEAESEYVFFPPTRNFRATQLRRCSGKARLHPERRRDPADYTPGSRRACCSS